jgi:hypothetical protein
MGDRFGYLPAADFPGTSEICICTADAQDTVILAR